MTTPNDAIDFFQNLQGYFDKTALIYILLMFAWSWWRREPMKGMKLDRKKNVPSPQVYLLFSLLGIQTFLSWLDKLFNEHPHAHDFWFWLGLILPGIFLFWLCDNYYQLFHAYRKLAEEKEFEQKRKNTDAAANHEV